MRKRIKTAEEHIKDMDRLKARQARERAEFRKKQAEQEAYEDLRDDVMSIVKNSGLSFADIHNQFGPHPSTLENWAQRKIVRPQLGKLQAALRPCGFDIGIVSGKRKRGK